jgi:hypothetical protein
MRESLMYGSVRGARGNSRPYRDVQSRLDVRPPILDLGLVHVSERFRSLLLGWPIEEF